MSEQQRSILKEAEKAKKKLKGLVALGDLSCISSAVEDLIARDDRLVEECLRLRQAVTDFKGYVAEQDPGAVFDMETLERWAREHGWRHPDDEESTNES